MANNKLYPPITPNTFKAVLPANTPFTFVSAYTIFPYRPATGSEGATSTTNSDTYIEEVFRDGDGRPIFQNTYRIIESPGTVRFEGTNIGFTTTLDNGATYKVTYTLQSRGGSGTPYFNNTVSYTFAFDTLNRQSEITDYLVRLTQDIDWEIKDMRNGAAHKKGMFCSDAETCSDYLIFGKKLILNLVNKIKPEFYSEL